jgi:hypothetical protein
MDAHVSRFGEEVNALLSDWKSIDLRVVASRSGDRWIYGAVRAVLDSTDPSVPTRQDLPAIDGLLVAHERWDIRRLPDLLDSLSSYQLQVQGRTIAVENANTSPPMSYSFEQLSRREAVQRLGISSYTFYLQSWWAQQMIEGDLRLTLDTKLRVGEHPWDGTEDLLRNFVGVSPNYIGPTPSKLVEVIAPVSVWIADATFSGSDGMIVNVEKSPTLSGTELGLSSIGYVAGEGQVRFRAFQKSVVDDTHLTFKVTFPKTVQSATAILTYHQLDVDSAKIFGKGKNPRLVMLREDKPEDYLISLKDEKDKLFEDRVSLLLHFLGLSPGHYGRAYQDNADIVAFSNSGDWALNVECTTRDIDLNDKLSKLATRTKLLAAYMSGVSVYPVLVTRFPRVLINETEKDKARVENISLVTADEFDTLMRMAIECAEVAKVRDYILGLIPGANPGMVLT